MHFLKLIGVYDERPQQNGHGEESSAERRYEQVRYTTEQDITRSNWETSRIRAQLPTWQDLYDPGSAK